MLFRKSEKLLPAGGPGIVSFVFFGDWSKVLVEDLCSIMLIVIRYIFENFRFISCSFFRRSTQNIIRSRPGFFFTSVLMLWNKRCSSWMSVAKFWWLRCHHLQAQWFVTVTKIRFNTYMITRQTHTNLRCGQ